MDNLEIPQIIEKSKDEAIAEIKAIQKKDNRSNELLKLIVILLLASLLAYLAFMPITPRSIIQERNNQIIIATPTGTY